MRHLLHYIPCSAPQLPLWKSAWALANILLQGTAAYLDLRQLGSPGFWCLQALKDRNLDGRGPGTVRTPVCISGTGVSWIPSLGPDFADSPQQLGTTLQGYTKSSSIGKRMLSSSYDYPNKIKLLTPASLFTCLTTAFQSVRAARTFPSCERLAKSTKIHCRRPRQSIFAGLCLTATN